MTTDHAGSVLAFDSDAARFWQAHYQAQTTTTQSRTARPRANPLLVETAASLTPGAALDLGCGAGGDTLRLAELGWRVTAVDISSTTLDRIADHARSLGLSDRVVAERHDLSLTFPNGTFDLICAQYLHTPVALPRPQVLRTAAGALRPGGRLLVVDHGSVAPWSWNQDPTTRFPTPHEVAAELGLDPSVWVVERADSPTRRATGPGGQSAQVVDHVLIIRRLTPTDQT